MSNHIELVSAGGVVFRDAEGGVEIVLITTDEEFRWQLPKGLIDEGETEEQAALREVSEETGVEGRILRKLDVIDYWFVASYDGPHTRYHKHVHFFLMEYLSGSTTQHDDEVLEARWFPLAEAIQILEFDTERAVLEKAFSIHESS